MQCLFPGTIDVERRIGLISSTHRRHSSPPRRTPMAQPVILVFDSGLGGLTVFREIAAARPDARLVYAADDAFFPYGAHGEAALIARVVALMGELIARTAAELVVVA